MKSRTKYGYFELIILCCMLIALVLWMIFRLTEVEKKLEMAPTEAIRITKVPSAPRPMSKEIKKKKWTRKKKDKTSNGTDHLNRTSKEGSTTNQKNPTPSVKDIFTPYPFDPNQLDFKELKRWGLSQKTASNWSNYLAAGATFKIKEDVRKIYSLTDEEWNLIHNYISLPEKKKKKTLKNIRLEINTAQVDDWKAIRGIGEVLSSRIVKFRDRLGGFARISQIKETYGVSDSLFTAIRDQLYLVKGVAQLDLNLAGSEELAYHPYISFKEAKVITNFRNQHGAYSSIEDLMNTKVIDEDWLKKTSPYLKITKPPEERINEE